MNRFRDKNDLYDWIAENLPRTRRSIKRALVGDGSVKLLARSLNDVPGWYVEVTSKCGNKWLLGVVVNEGGTGFKLMILPNKEL